MESYNTEKIQNQFLSDDIYKLCRNIKILDDSTYLINMPNQKLEFFENNDVSFVNYYGFNKELIWHNVENRIRQI